MPANVKQYRQENKARKAKLFEKYDPFKGIGSPLKRVRVAFTVHAKHIEEFYTLEMVEKEKWILLLRDQQSVENAIREMGVEPTDELIDSFMNRLTRTRLKYDFEYWAFVVGKIQDKESKKPIPFRLNKPQRKLLGEYEADRLKGDPIRTVIVKARQWGGSTLTELYMAWIQTEWKENWHSAIVADVEDQVRNIRAMYTRFAKNYPKDLGTVTLGSYEGSTKNRIVKERGCIIGVGSAQKPDSLRSFDFAMLHLSEAGLWKTTQGKSPKDLMQSLRSTVPDVPLSMIVIESTAKGVGNFFHDEWLSAVRGDSEYTPVFVSWWEFEKYQRDIENVQRFVNWIEKDDYAMYLWNLGATLEGINWYFTWKKGKNYDDWRMQSEYPSTDKEAFQSTGQRVYPPRYVQNARNNCTPPGFIGDMTGKANRGKEALINVDFFHDPNGLLSIWGFPDNSIKVSHRYAVIVDIGGTTPKADNSVIKVYDRYWMIDGGCPEPVAVWEGHLDQDLIAWKAAQIGWWYNKGLVVIEANSLRKEENTEGTHYLTVLDEIVPFYPNMYMRTDPEKVRQGLPAQYGFQTSVTTKSLVINRHKAAVRDNEIIERDKRACDEMDTYEVKPNGSLGAVDGCRDDHVIVSAIGSWICLNYMPMPVEITVLHKDIPRKQVKGESSF